MAPRPILARALDAAARPANLVAPGLGVVTAGGLVAMGLAPFALAVGALSLGTWSALVAWDLATPPRPVEPPVEPDLASPQLDALLDAVRASASKVRDEVLAHDGVLSASLLALVGECDDLVETASRAARRGDAVWQRLAALDIAAMKRDVELRRQAARQAADSEVAASFGRAADAKQRELDAWRDTRVLVERIVAELVATEAALGELHARVVRLTLHDPGDPDAYGAGIGPEIKVLKERLDVLERSAARTLEEVG